MCWSEGKSVGGRVLGEKRVEISQGIKDLLGRS